MGIYLEDTELNSVLEDYFNEEDNDTEKVELYKNGDIEQIKEGLISKMKDYNDKKLKEQQDKLVEKFKQAMKENKYKYYVVTVTVNYRDGIPSSTNFNLYGSDVRPFTKKDKGLFIGTWKRDMKAKRIAFYSSTMMTDIKYIPSEITKYML